MLLGALVIIAVAIQITVVFMSIYMFCAKDTVKVSLKLGYLLMVYSSAVSIVALGYLFKLVLK